MTPEQFQTITFELSILIILGVLVVFMLRYIAVQVSDKLNQILERMGPKP
jgi:hypothetical protein